MATETIRINFVTNATQAQTAINNLRNGIFGLGRVTGNVVPAFGAMGLAVSAALGPMAALATLATAIVQIMRMFSSVVTTTTEFQDAMLELESVVAEDVKTVAELNENMAALDHTAREVGRTTYHSATSAAAGLRELAKAGLTAKQASEALLPTLNLARVGEISLADAAEKLADIMAAFGLEASEAPRVVDTLAFAAAKSTTDIAQMVEAFKYVSSAGGGMQQSLEGITAGIAVLSSMGVKASMAGTALRGTLVQLADTGSRAHKDLLALGLTTEDVLPSATNSLLDIMKRARAAGLNASNAYAIFGQRAGVAANVFTQFYERLETFNTLMEDVEGSASRMAQTMDSGMSGAMKRVRNAWEAVMISLGKGPFIDALSERLRNFADVLLEVSRVIDVLQSEFSMGRLGGFVRNTMISAFGDALNYFFSFMQRHMAGVMAATYATMQTIASGEFWEAMRLIFVYAGNSIVAASYSVASILSSAILPLVENLVNGFSFINNMFTAAWYYVSSLYYANIHDPLMRLVQWFRDSWDWVVNRAIEIKDHIEEGFSKAVDYVKDINARMSEIIRNFINGAYEFAVRLIKYLGPIAEFFGFDVNELPDTLEGALERGGEAIADSINGAIDGAADAVTNAFTPPGQAGGPETEGQRRAREAQEKASSAFDAALTRRWDGVANRWIETINEAQEVAASNAASAWEDASDSAGGVVRSFMDVFTGYLEGIKGIEQLVDVDKARQEILEAFSNVATPSFPDDVAGGRRAGSSDDGVFGGGAAARALAGANAIAVNAIMGRTHNEIVTQQMIQQTKVMKDTHREIINVRKELEKITQNTSKNTPDYSTFR